MLRFIRRGPKYTAPKAPHSGLCNSESVKEKTGRNFVENEENAETEESSLKEERDLSYKMDEMVKGDLISKEAGSDVHVVHDTTSGDVVLGLVGRSNSESPMQNGLSVQELTPIMEDTQKYWEIGSDKPVHSVVDVAGDFRKMSPRSHDVALNGDVYSVPHHLTRPRRPPPPPNRHGRGKGQFIGGIKPVAFDPTYKNYRAALRSPSGKPKATPKIMVSRKKDKYDLKVSFRDDDSIIQCNKKPKDRRRGRLLDVPECKPLNPDGGRSICDSDDNLSVASEESDMSELQPRRMRMRRTIAHMFAWVAMGLFMETIGPNLVYLMSRVKCTYHEISHPLMTRAGFSFLGSALGGILCEVLPHLTDLWLAIALVLGSGGTAAAPWCEDLLYLNLALGATGLGKGLLIVASLSYGCQVWPEKSYHLMVFLVHFCYAIGASAAPQLTYLFESGLMDNILEIQANTTHTASTNGHHGNNHTTSPPDGLIVNLSREMYSFDVIAVVCFLTGAAFLALLGTSLANATTISPEVEEEIRERKAQNLKPVSWFVGHELPGLRIIFFFLVFSVLPLVTITIFGRWLVEITHNSLGTTPFWDRPMCLLVQTIFWASCAAGLVITPLARKCLPPNGLMITFTTMSLISTALLCVYFHKFVIFVWIFVSLLGVFSAPLLPMGLSYCNAFISQSPIGIALLTCMCSLTEILTSWQASFLFHHFRPTTLLYLAASASVLIFICYLPIIPSLIKRQWRPHSAVMKVNMGGYAKAPQV